MRLPTKMVLPLIIIKWVLKLIHAPTCVFCTATFSRVRVNATTSARRQQWAHTMHVLLIITVLSRSVGAGVLLVAMGMKCYFSPLVPAFGTCVPAAHLEM